MHIHLEKNQHHAIQSYDDTSVVIDGKTYTTSLILSREQLLFPATIDLNNLESIRTLKPTVILLGFSQTRIQLPIALQIELSQCGIGVECMQLGAACRTFNILLSEEREVALGLIFN